MKTHTYGSDEGYDAVHLAMLEKIHTTGAYHTSLNVVDSHMLLSALQTLIETPSVSGVSKEQEQLHQELRNWAEGFYQSIATTLDIELV